MTGLAGVDMDANGQDKDRIESEKDESVEGHSLAVGLHAAEVHIPVVSRYLKEKSGCEQHEEHDADQYGRPVRHFLLEKTGKCLIWLLEEWDLCVSVRDWLSTKRSG